MKKKPSATANLLEQSAWAQADEFLAKALVDSERLCARIDRSMKRAPRETKKSLGLIEGDALLVRQSISEAAALRGLASFGVAGEICAFDAARYELSPRAKVPKTGSAVRIKTPGVLALMKGGKERIIIRAKSGVVQSRAPAKVARSAR